MTAWTTLLNNLFLPGKPITGATGTALRDNPIAIAEGDATVHTAGTAIRAAAMRGVTAGSEVAFTVSGALAEVLTKTNAGTGTLAVGPIKLPNSTITALRAGDVTVSAQLARTQSGSVASGDVRVEVYKNGTLALSLIGTTASYVVYTGNLTFAAGDVIEFAMAMTGNTTASGGSQTGYARLVQCLADKSSFWGL